MVKRALLIGINYTGSQYALRGCINDVQNLRSHLLTRGFEAANIRFLTDVTNDVSKQSLLTAIREFISSLQGGDYGVFHYSGHGGQIKDFTRDETDGRDECIYAFVKPNRLEPIIDDTLRVELVDKLHPNAILRCVLDCCNSGTGMDLPYFYYPRGTLSRDARESLSTKDVVCISGCKDNQTSADSVIQGQPQGALTASLLLALHHLKGDSWQSLALLVDYELRRGRYTQVSVMSTTNKDILQRKVDL